MNPSSQGWINKYSSLFEDSNVVFTNESKIPFYDQLKSTGFIYGVSFSLYNKNVETKLAFTQEEMTKVNLLDALLHTYFVRFDTDFLKAITHINDFYKKINHQKNASILFNLFSKNDDSQQLESIINTRVQNNTLAVKKDTASFFSYTLLYIDVITFEAFCEGYPYCEELYEVLEEVVINMCFYSLKVKATKSKYDKSILSLFEESISQSTTTKLPIKSLLARIPHSIQSKIVFKNYVLDLCCLAMYDDRNFEPAELSLLETICKSLSFPTKAIDKAVGEIITFSEIHEVEIHLFQYSNPVKQLYKQTSSTVKTLIVRNKDRLLQELSESRELLVLLGQSTLRDLDPIEKKKVRSQLLDVCKTIPSLTIFLLPGGTLLLPLLAKFIPQLLPSAFDDNRIEKK